MYSPILENPPLLTPNQAHLSALGLTLSYVGSLYISKLGQSRTRPSRPTSSKSSPNRDILHAAVTSISPTIQPISTSPSPVPRSRSSSPQPGTRDHPDVIRSRVKAVTASTLAGCVGVWAVVRVGLGDVVQRNLACHHLGLSHVSISSADPPSNSLLPYILAPLLFLGPLYTTYLDQELPWQTHGRGFGWLRGVSPCGQDGKMSLMELRNYVAGPISEEIMFRSCIIAVYALSGASTRTLVFGTPLWFGVAHAHHAWEVFVKGGKTGSAALQAVVGSLFQFTYTSLFGWYAAWLFVRTKSVLPAITSHVFCNLMGLPNPGPTISAYPEKRNRVWLAYMVGIGAFVWGIRSL